MPPRLLDRDDEAQVPHAGADRVQDRVRGWGEDDLASLGIARRALDVGHQREPVKPRMWASKPQALRDHGGPPVGGDHERRRESLHRRGAPPESDGLADDAGDARALPEEVDHAHPLADGDADLPGPLHERRVQHPAAHGEGARPIAGARAV